VDFSYAFFLRSLQDGVGKRAFEQAGQNGDDIEAHIF
jgi:hypothetical protein